MTSHLSSRTASTLDLAVGLATYDKLPLALKVGAKDQIESGELEYELEFIEPSTGTYWTATSRFVVDRDHASTTVQYWSEQDTGRDAVAGDISQQAIALQAFCQVPGMIGQRMFIQAIEWLEFDA